MVIDPNILKEKLVEAWKLRSNETSFSASLSPLIAECQSDDEFRTIFTKQLLTHLDSTISSNLLQSYFKFHTRSGYINEFLVIEHLISLKPSPSMSTNDIQIKFLIELLNDILKNVHLSSKHAVCLGKQINNLAQWLCSALSIYSNQTDFNEEMLDFISNFFLLLFTNSTLYCLWLMTIKAQKEQNHWRQIQEQFQTKQTNIRSEIYERILFKIAHLHLSDEFHQENIEFNISIFYPTVSTLVINQLHHSSSILLLILRFYEHVSSTSNPSAIYLRLLQASFGGYISSITSNNSEYQQRWSAFIHFQLPRIFASCFQSQFHAIKQAIETFLLHNEYLLNRLDEFCLENVIEQFVQTILDLISNEIKIKYQQNIDELKCYIQQIRRHFTQQYYQTHSYTYEILQLQRSLEKTLIQIFSYPINEENLNILVQNLTDYIPLICALDLYYDFINLLLSYTNIEFDLAFYILCYVTLILDDTSEDFGQLNIPIEKNSSISIIYIWLKKYWLSCHYGHALFASSLQTIDFLSTRNLSNEKDEFLNEIQQFDLKNFEKKTFPSCEYLIKTICLLDELSSLVFEETKQTILQLIHYLTNISYSSLLHVLLWLIANYQIAIDEERLWIQNVIHRMGETTDSTSTISSLLDAIKRQLWSQYIDNPLLPFYSLNPILSSLSIVNNPTLTSYQTATILIQSLFDTYVINEFLTSEQTRALYICSKYLSIDHLIVRLLININASNGIYETSRALYFIFSIILFRRRSSTRCLFEQVIPYLFNLKSNDFMLEPNVYIISLILNILLVLEVHGQHQQTFDDLFRVKSWKDRNVMNENFHQSILVENEDDSVIDAYRTFLDYSSDERFSSDTLRPVNFFLGWFQTILWMFSRTAKALKPFVKSKLIAQLAEYLPLQFPIEKVLSILEFSTNEEIEYASMVITRDYSHLHKLGMRTSTKLIQNQSLVVYENCSTTSMNITKTIYSIPSNL